MGSVLGAEHILLMALSRCSIQNISNTFLSVDGFAIPFSVCVCSSLLIVSRVLAHFLNISL